MELKITKERILEAASRCSTAKQTLKILFPEAFVEEVNQIFQIGDQLAQKDSNKVYLISKDSDNYLRIVSITAGYIWMDQKIKINDSKYIAAQDVTQVFGQRRLKDYVLIRNRQSIEL